MGDGMAMGGHLTDLKNTYSAILECEVSDRSGSEVFDLKILKQT